MTMIIHAAETCSYAIRAAGVRTGKFAVSLSLAGMVLLISRTSNLVQAPMMGKVIDYAKSHDAYDLEQALRYILGAASIGTMVAIIVFPSLVLLFSRMIAHFEVRGSVPKLIAGVTVSQLRNVRTHLRRPRLEMLRSLRWMGVPKRLLLLNCVVTAIYTVGVLASLNAAYLAPELSTAASQSSGLINGIATIILTIFIDPQLALLTDKSLGDPKQRARLGKVFALLMVSRFFGTLLAQLILLPATYWIIWVIQFI